ncbi:putative signaling protein [Andreprevotia sp. IGB-42]|uniref:sensor domain-containing diguanylate cyclase n=1 Tax=Andreprevotia sp. IGB-42 TaxID=2497473 RepID=UPI00135B3236|nr:diguanylate cyclase [Andreprevotia sp. IGB-42]KAF0812066.1 putative signaling protein [Andreprevotia sp. IGB-42]
MIAPSLPANEAARIALLHRLDILDTPAEDDFDRITRLAARILGMPVALITLVDTDRQWFKSRYGLDVSETARELSFCAHAINGEGAMVVNDAHADARFVDNPLVTGQPHVRFYAGQPLKSRDGLALGTLCVIDQQPRQLDAADLQALQDLGHVAEQALQARELVKLSRKLHVDTQQALNQQEALYRETFEQAPMGIAHITPDGQWLTANSYLIDLLGYRRDTLFKCSLSDLVDAADWKKLSAQTSRLISGYITDFQQEVRFHRGHREHFWGNLTVALHRNEQGVAEHFILIVENIELRKAATAALETMQRSLEQRVIERTAELVDARHELITIIDHLPILIAYIDRQRKYRFVNALYGEWLDLDHKALIGKEAYRLLSQPDREQLQPYIDKVMQGMTVKFNLTQRFHGLVRDVRYTMVPDEDASHHVRGYYQMVQDISQINQLMAQLRDQAFADTLTGLPNRRAMLEELKGAILRQKRHKRPLAALFLDLDGFKSVNDSLGHDAGDELLKQFAGRLKACVREMDSVARLGGDEFTILLQGLTDAPQDAAQVAGKIIAAMADPFPLEGQHVTISTSIGIAIRHAEDSSDGDALLGQADEAMYRAKRGGKNRYVMS